MSDREDSQNPSIHSYGSGDRSQTSGSSSSSSSDSEHPATSPQKKPVDASTCALSSSVVQVVSVAQLRESPFNGRGGRLRRSTSHPTRGPVLRRRQGANHATIPGFDVQVGRIGEEYFARFVKSKDEERARMEAMMVECPGSPGQGREDKGQMDRALRGLPPALCQARCGTPVRGLTSLGYAGWGVTKIQKLEAENARAAEEAQKLEAENARSAEEIARLEDEAT
ncbi:unnamed protein product [Cuscuta campestris]|uniref:Uncharacterized protein n=1 Tax=Cuscuta campestris TaxID=132261 RepID=A0A484KSI2_9ASTE|nr:unnamed protein product [Cuscuta campestris]